MLALALVNKAKAGATNVEFLKGHIESIPLPSNTVDVIISNCVINLSGDKRRVLAEAFRVLRPGGRFAVSDVIVREGLPEPVRASMPLWTGCVAGALEEREFLSLLAEVGFEQASIESLRASTRAMMRPPSSRERGWSRRWRTRWKEGSSAASCARPNLAARDRLAASLRASSKR